MKAKLLIAVIFAAMLALMGYTLFATMRVAFAEAVFFIDMETGGMNIDFGAQALPMDEAYYQTYDGDHTLRVCDTRARAGGWFVNAVMSPLTNGSESLSCGLCVYAPYASPGIQTSAGGFPAYVYINTTARSVMSAPEGLEAGEYDFTALEENTFLHVGSLSAPLLKPLAYTATVTWTLTLSP